MKNKTIILIDRGAMCGIFSGGVVKKLEELNIYDKIEAIYAVSVGAFNAAYFLAKQTKPGANIYFDYLTKDFISFKKFFPGLMQRLISGTIYKIPEHKMLNAVDIDYVIDVVQNKVPLNIDYLKKQPINLYVKLLNIKKNKSEYFSIKDHDIFKLLRATCCIAPYTIETQEINGEHYIDGTIADPIGLKELRDIYPNHKIVFISNSREETSGIRHILKAIAEGIVASAIHGKILFKAFVAREKRQNRI